jgi:acyl carrier protein/NAD(P)-dependent dehydrogenase (short-subunit alcohol dehydrogenase family)
MNSVQDRLWAAYCGIAVNIANWPDSVFEVVYLWGMDTIEFSDLDRAVQLCVQTPVRLMKALAQQERSAIKLWLITRGAQATNNHAPTAAGALQAMLWGVGRVFGLESPDRYRRLIDLDADRSPEEIAADLLGELLHEDVEDQIVHRAGQRLVPRLKRSNNTTRGVGARLRSDSSYLITGGLESVGRSLTRWAAEAGARHLVLLGHTLPKQDSSPLTAERARFLEELKALDVSVSVVEGDAASTETMARVFGLFGREHPELRGIFHAEMAQGVAELAESSDEQVAEMLRQRILGTSTLHEWTRNRNLDFLIAFSSTSSLLGSLGMTHHAAANQFLDNFAHSRRAQRLSMLSVTWGAWHEMGSASTTAANHPFPQIGLLPMESATALQWMPQLISSSLAHVMITDVDWKTLKAIYEGHRVLPMLTDTESASVISETSTSSPLIPAMAPEERRDFIKQSVISASAKVLGFRAGEVPPVDVPLTDLGLDSLMAVDLRNRLHDALGRKLPPTIVFDYPTISELVSMLETILWVADIDGNRDSLPLQDEIRI